MKVQDLPKYSTGSSEKKRTKISGCGALLAREAVIIGLLPTHPMHHAWRQMGKKHQNKTKVTLSYSKNQSIPQIV